MSSIPADWSPLVTSGQIIAPFPCPILYCSTGGTCAENTLVSSLGKINSPEIQENSPLIEEITDPLGLKFRRFPMLCGEYWPSPTSAAPS